MRARELFAGAAIALAVAMPAQDTARAVVIECVDHHGQPVPGAEISVLQNNGVSDFRLFGPYTTDSQGRARCPVAMTFQGGLFDRVIYGRVPGRLVGIAWSWQTSTESLPQNPGDPVQLRLCPSQQLSGEIDLPPDYASGPVRVSVTMVAARDCTLEPNPNELGTALHRCSTFPGVMPEVFEFDARENGEFVLMDMPLHARFSLVFEAKALGQARYTNWDHHGGLNDTGDLRIQMHPEAVLGGMVRGPNGRPVAGARITAWEYGAMGREPFSVRTDNAGRYRLEGLPQATYEVRVLDPRRPGMLRPFQVELAAGEVIPHQDIQLERGTEVSGTLVDADTGRPIPSVEVLAKSPSGYGLYPVTFDRMFTDIEGRFRLSVPSGEVWLELSNIPPTYRQPEPWIVYHLDLGRDEPYLQDLRIELQGK